MSANPIDEAVRDAAFHLIEVIRSIPETDLLALDSDPHPPSSLSVLANDLEAALAAAQQQATLVNPHTGEPRDYRDVNSDPAGVLCVKPGAPLVAAQQQQGQAVASVDLYVYDTDAEPCSDGCCEGCHYRPYTAPPPSVADEADELLRGMGLEPGRFRTEGGALNAGKVRAAILHPSEYDGHYLAAAPDVTGGA